MIYHFIKEAFEKEKEKQLCIDLKCLLLVGIATSIDALAVGVSLAFLRVEIWSAILIIGLTTALFSVGGMYIGKFFGSRFKSKAEFAGGIVLCCIGLKILLEHTLLV